MRLFLFLHLEHRIFGALPILCIGRLKGRRKWISLCKIENIQLSIRAFLKPVSKRFTPYIKTDNNVYLNEVWSWNKFERYVVVSTIRLKGEVNFFIREFWKSFTFLVTLLLYEKIFKNYFWEVSVLSKCFQSLRIEPIISLYIFFGWQQENLVSCEISSRR